MQVVMSRQEVINTMREQWLTAHPALLVSHFEQLSSVRDAREKEAKEEERRQAAIEEALAKRMEKLEMVEASSSNTTTAERPIRALGKLQLISEQSVVLCFVFNLRYPAVWASVH